MLWGMTCERCEMAGMSMVCLRTSWVLEDANCEIRCRHSTKVIEDANKCFQVNLKDWDHQQGVSCNCITVCALIGVFGGQRLYSAGGSERFFCPIVSCLDNWICTFTLSLMWNHSCSMKLVYMLLRLSLVHIWERFGIQNEMLAVLYLSRNIFR